MTQNLHDERVYFFSMIADEVRHAIIEYLLNKERATVSELIKELGKPQTLISYHLRCLRECGIVMVKRPPNDRRKRVYYLHDYRMIKDLFTRVNSFFSSLNGVEITQQEQYFGKNRPPRLQFFTMVADEVRHEIVHWLLKKEKASVSELLKLTKKPQTLISYHLRCLRDCGMVLLEEKHDDKRKRIYKLRKPELIKSIFDLADNFLESHETCKDYPACRMRPNKPSSLQEKVTTA